MLQIPSLNSELLLNDLVVLQIVEDTINIGAQTGVTLKGQTEQMGRIVNDLDTIHFSIKKAANLLKEISRQVSC